MKKQWVIISLVVLVVVASFAGSGRVAVEAITFDSPLPVFLPMLFQGDRLCYEHDNLVCNPGAECDELCWQFEYPDSGNVICGCNGNDCPVANDGDCQFRYGGWHNMVESGLSADFYLDARTDYELTMFWQVWSDEYSFVAYDTLNLYLVNPSGHHQYLFEITNVSANTQWWKPYQMTISPVASGIHQLMFVAINDEEKHEGTPGLTDWFIDDIRLRDFGRCQECVQCQVNDRPPDTYCEFGRGVECEGCCPDGDDCEGLNPRCPALPPPAVVREIDRWTTCYGAQQEVQIGADPVPPARELPDGR